MRKRLRPPGFVAWSKNSDSPGWVEDENGCHIWHGATTAVGYAVGSSGGKMALIHRARYEREVGPIPEGMQLDHYVCDNGAGGCCNPHHCRPVTVRENVLRSSGFAAKNAAKTHCPKGHRLAGANLAPAHLRRGSRVCRKCVNEQACNKARRTKRRR